MKLIELIATLILAAAVASGEKQQNQRGWLEDLEGWQTYHGSRVKIGKRGSSDSTLRTARNESMLRSREI